MSGIGKKFAESFLDRNDKVDHKRLTVFSFVLLFWLAAIVALFRQKEITNEELVETVLYIAASVILGGMGFSMINKPTRNATNQELHTEGTPPERHSDEMGV